MATAVLVEVLIRFLIFVPHLGNSFTDFNWIYPVHQSILYNLGILKEKVQQRTWSLIFLFHLWWVEIFRGVHFEVCFSLTFISLDKYFLLVQDIQRLLQDMQ